jgi:predicted Rossmann fold nucleotide-binding protein DprA/Smf involved in DNA uptake
VLEALGRLNLQPHAVTSPGRPRDSAAAAVLAALDGGARDFDDLVAAARLAPPVALAALTLLELEGAVESRGASAYARVAAALRGEEHGR